MTKRRVMVDPELEAAFAAAGLLPMAETILNSSLLSSHRLKAIMRALDATRELPGVTAEAGCAAGGTSIIIASSVPTRHHFACDTFVGLVDCGPVDTDLKNGDFGRPCLTVDAVRGRMNSAGLTNVEFVCGYFPGSAPESMREARFALAHLDTDTYESIRAGFDFFAPRMVSGGLLLIDDVIGKGTVGGKLAWKELLARGDKSWTVIEENDPQAVVRFA